MFTTGTRYVISVEVDFYTLSGQHIHLNSLLCFGCGEKFCHVLSVWPLVIRAETLSWNFYKWENLWRGQVSWSCSCVTMLVLEYTSGTFLHVSLQRRMYAAFFFFFFFNLNSFTKSTMCPREPVKPSTFSSNTIWKTEIFYCFIVHTVL